MFYRQGGTTFETVPTFSTEREEKDNSPIEADMASASSVLSEEQFQCSICLDVFTQPVSIPCGHNFCKACITGYWDSSGLSQCPLCTETFSSRPELPVNTGFRDIVEQFKKMRVKNGDESPAGPGEVPCDICTGTKLKALKSCLVCLASYCESHLEPHQRVAALKRHKLIDPVENLEDRMCKKHNKMLELFCKSDEMCVCVTCMKDDHATHETVSVEEEYGKRKTQLGEIQTDLKQLRQAKSRHVQKIKCSVKQSKTVAEKEIADSVKVFTALMASIERSQAELIGVIEEKQRAAEKQAEGLIKEVEQEIAEIHRRSTELERLSHTEDHLHLLHRVLSLSTPPPTRDWSQISIHSNLSVGTVSRAAAQLEETLGKELKRMIREVKFIDAEKTLTETLKTEMDPLHDARLKSIQQDHAVDVTLDPNTANFSIISLSVDGKQAKYDTIAFNFCYLFDYPKMFVVSPFVLGKEGFSSGKFYYEVQVKGKSGWTVGVVRESINRREVTPISPQNGYWTLVQSGNQCVANESLCPVEFFLRKRLEKVGVFVDYEGGEVSFYDVDTRTLIYSFRGCTFSHTSVRGLFYSLFGNFSSTEKLYPFFSTGVDDVPLIITPVNHTG